MSQILRALLLAGFFFGLTALLSHAQENEAGGVEEAAPPTVYLRDKNGNLVPVPGFSYERYRELVLAEGRGPVAEPPPFSIERLHLQGSAKGKTIEFEAEFTIVSRDSGWIMVPLRMQGTVLRDSPIAPSDVQSVHRYEVKEGHLLWLEATRDQRYVIKLPLAGSIAETSGDQQFQISLPKASETRLIVDVPGQLAHAAVGGEEGLVETMVRGNDTRISVLGPAGDITLTWRRDQAANRQVELDITSEISVHLEAQEELNYAAAIKASRPGEPIRTVFVRLPPETKLVERTARGFKASVAASADVSSELLAGKPAAPESVVRVDFERPNESVDFSLEATRLPRAEPTNAPLETAGFEVLGAGKQTGHVSLFAPTGWSLKALPGATAFRVDDVATLPGQTRATARYRFLRQPYSLPIVAEPQPARTVVEPSYLAIVERQRVTLMGTLEYQVRGPRPEFLEIELGDWILESAGPETLIKAEPVRREGEPLRLLLQPGGETEFTIQLHLHRPVTADSLELAFGLPRPLASQALPATLAVSVANNIALVPKTEELRSFLQDDRLPLSLQAVSGQRPLIYREVPAAAEPARFVASFQVRKRRVTVVAEARAQLGASHAAIEQKLSCDIDYEPLQVVTFEALVQTPLTGLQVFHGNQLLDLQEVTLEDSARDGRTIRRWRADLPEPISGAQTLLVQYAVDLPHRDTIELPLVTPVEGDGLAIARQKLTVESRTEPAIMLDESRADDPGLSVTETQQGLELVWPRRSEFVSLQRGMSRSSVGPDVRVEKLWFQTWIGDSGRRDRLAARVVGMQDRIRILLPPGVASDEIRVLVDGEAPRELLMTENGLTIGIAMDGAEPRTIEVWYLLAGFEKSFWPEKRVLELPRIAGAATPQQTWIQVLTPPGEQVLYSPSPVTPQTTWRKEGWSWRASGTRTTQDLEVWLGASAQNDDYPTGLNDALFMTLGPAHSIEVVVWSKRWLWVVVGGGVLAVGLVFYSLSRGRSLYLITAFGAVICLAAMISPDLTLAVSQFAGVGLLLLVAVIWSFRMTGQMEEMDDLSLSDSTIHLGGSRSRVTRRELAATTSLPLSAGDAEMRP